MNNNDEKGEKKNLKFMNSFCRNFWKGVAKQHTIESVCVCVCVLYIFILPNFFDLPVLWN